MTVAWKNRRIALLGGKPLTGQCLQLLHKYHKAGEIDIVGVLPRPAGARGWWSAPGVEEARDVATRLGLPILERAEELLELEVDLGISVLHAAILPRNIVEHPRGGFLNLHGAPLPHYRGCNVCSHAIINGETRFGVTLHFMDERVDHGDIIEVAWFKVDPGVTARVLMVEAERAALSLFERRLPDMLSGDLPRRPQADIIERDGVVSRYYPRDSLSKPGAKEVDLSWPPEQVLRHVRGLDFPPFEPAYAVVDGWKVYMSMGDPVDASPAPQPFVWKGPAEGCRCASQRDETSK